MSKHKVDINSKQGKKVMGKERKAKALVEEVRKAENVKTKKTPEPECREESLLVNADTKLESENWAKNATPDISFDISEKSKDHIPDDTEY